MIQGVVNADYEAVIPLIVQGPSGQSREIEAVVDTGFNDFLTLPAELAAVASGALQTDIASLPALSGDGAYHIFTAHWRSDCHYSKTAARATLGGPSGTPSLSASDVTQTGATLAIASHPGTWYYRADTGPDATYQSPVQAATETLTGLTSGTSYIYSAYSHSACTTGNLLATAAAFTTS